jgi:hypothetical protein
MLEEMLAASDAGYDEALMRQLHDDEALARRLHDDEALAWQLQEADFFAAAAAEEHAY